MFRFQSLIGIIEDFDAILRIRSVRFAMFQSLIGIIEDFDHYTELSSDLGDVSIPDRDYRGFRLLIGTTMNFILRSFNP